MEWILQVVTSLASLLSTLLACIAGREGDWYLAFMALTMLALTLILSFLTGLVRFFLAFSLLGLLLCFVTAQACQASR